MAGYTKRQFIEKAFEEIGYASYVYDLEPEQLESALFKLDAMVATWNSVGIKLNYPLPESPGNSDLDQSSNVPDLANEAVIFNLAVKLAPSIGKVISPDTKKSARSAYLRMLTRFASPQQMKFPNTLIAGAGNRNYSSDSTFILSADNNVLTPPDQTLEFEP